MRGRRKRPRELNQAGRVMTFGPAQKKYRRACAADAYGCNRPIVVGSTA
jgi:hypothetical protein